MRAVVTKSISQESAAENHVKTAQNQTQPAALANISVIPGITPLIQRKSLCPCDGGCPRCANGQPLPQSNRTFFEHRFGCDFSQVRVHTDAGAAEAARSINARAFTLGQHILFGAGQYSPGTLNGKRLLAHELTHTIQQQVRSTGDSAVIQREVHPPSPTGPTGPTTPPARGTNPANCMNRVCLWIGRQRPSNRREMQSLVQSWRNRSLFCLRRDAPHSNASHHLEILQNNVDEIEAWKREITAGIGGNPRQFVIDLQDFCMNKKREAELEFHHNFVFESFPNQQEQWVATASEWDAFETALSHLPPGALWTSPRLIRFQRLTQHPTDPNVGGRADWGTGIIEIYNIGLGSQPAPRAQSLNLPATTQTMLHEIGHLVMERIPQGDRDHFFHNLLHWHEDEWPLLQSLWVPVSPARTRLLATLGYNAAQFDAWLPTLNVDQPVTVNGYTCAKREIVPGYYLLQSYETLLVPPGPVFEYARTGRKEYLAELYALALTRPQFLHSAISAAQIDWLKRIVFQTPTDLTAFAGAEGHSGPIPPAFLTDGRQLFTRRQLRALLARLTTSTTSGP